MRARSAAALVAALALAAGLLTGCTPAEPADGPRAVTSEEAQLLALARFTNFDRGTRAFSTELAVSGVDTRVQGWVDYVAELGYATVSGSFGSEALLWSDGSLGSIPAVPDADGNPPLPIPDLADAAWQFQTLDASGSAFSALLAALSALGQDRPDNPLLLQQSGAMRLRVDDVAGTPVTVFAAPPDDAPDAGGELDPEASPLRLWVAEDGLLLRAEFRLDGRWITVELPDVAAPELELPEAAR